MALATGTKFGTYEIVAPIGSGGMGEVYETRDTQLGRFVDEGIGWISMQVPGIWVRQGNEWIAHRLETDF